MLLPPSVSQGSSQVTSTLTIGSSSWSSLSFPTGSLGLLQASRQLSGTLGAEHSVRLSLQLPRKKHVKEGLSASENTSLDEC